MSFALEISVSDNSPNAKPWDIVKDLGGQETFDDIAENFRYNHYLIAREALKREQQSGFDKDPQVRTDSRFNKPDYKVNFLGRIQYYAKIAGLEALAEMYQQVVNKSPVDTGQFISSNYVYYNARLVARGYAEFVAWLKFSEKSGFKNGDTIRFINVTPYASKLEYKGVQRNKRGRITHNAKTSQSKKQKNKIINRPNGSYYASYRSIISKYRGFASRIKFEFIPNGYAGIFVMADDKFRNSYVKTNKPYVYPSITITINEKGVLNE